MAAAYNRLSMVAVGSREEPPLVCHIGYILETVMIVFNIWAGNI
jgi:hypothetical protein